VDSLAVETTAIQIKPAEINRCFLIWNCLAGSLAVETAAIQTRTRLRGFKILVFLLVRVGGLRLCRREFHSPGLKYD